jgi:glycosyltransferase involved in cell wall biosynthesis
MLRVCSPQLGLAPDANLGGAVYDRELLRAMVARGATIDVLLPEGASVEEDVGWHITRTPSHRRSYYEYNWIFLHALRRHWRDRPADILRVHSPYSVGPGALVFARSVGVPVALHYLHREPRPLWRCMDALTLGRYDLIVTISDATCRDLVSAGIPRERIAVAYPGVDDTYVPGASRSPRSYLCAAYVGGLIARKNLEVALRAVARARADGIDVRFVIAGDGELGAALRRLASDLALGSAVEFRGRISHQAKLDLLRDTDIFLFPSRLEGFGMAAVEALACGTPVIGLRTTSTSEIVRHGETGLLLDDPDGVEAIANAIATLASSPVMRADMGRRGALDVRQRFSWAHSAATVMAAYRAVVEMRRAS